MTNSNLRVEQEMVFHEDKPKKKMWLWWFGGGCIILICMALGIIAFLLFYPSGEASYPLNGEISFPPIVKKGDDFDFVITLTNSTTEPVFIKHIVLHSNLNAPSFLDGARVTSVEPDMAAEPYGSLDDVQYSYFQEIKPGETLTVIFHMRAENIGTYYENVGVYAKHPLLPAPAFVDAFHYVNAEIEITP